MRQRFRQEHQPDSLAQRIALFKENAHAYQADGELFRVDSWTQVMFGQGIMPEHYHQATRAMKEKDLGQFLSTLRAYHQPGCGAIAESSGICESVLQGE